MTESALSRALPADFNRPVFLLYVLVALALFVLGLGYMLYKGKYIYLGLILASPVLVFIITQPKLAVGQYIIALFISRTILEGHSWLLADVSGLILITAALLDFLNESSFPDRLPRLSSNFLFLLLAVLIAAMFSYQPEAAINPLGRIALIFLNFLALYRLSGRVSISWSVNLFLLLAIIHSIAVSIPFLTSGGRLRSFGIAPVQVAMLALVVATAKFVWAKKGMAWIYLMTLVILFFALLSAQYRSLIMMGMAISALVILFSWQRSRKGLVRDSNKTSTIPADELRLVKKRPLYLLTGILCSVILAIVLNPQLLTPLLERFEGLLSYKPSGTFLLRTVLWKLAWSQFIDHPLVGMGPGLFNQLHMVVPTVRMELYYSYLRGLSAHNLFLHYLAEAGILGGMALLALIINQFRLSLITWQKAATRHNLEVAAILLGVAITILITTVTEASWLWGQSTYVFAFFLALIARNYNSLVFEK